MTTALDHPLHTAPQPSARRAGPGGADGRGAPVPGQGLPPSAAGAARVLLADGHHLFRSGLGALLDREADLSVVAETGSGEDAVEQAALVRPAVAVVDLAVPGLGGPATARLIRERVPETAVLLLTALPRPAELRQALAEDVRGLLPKTVQAATLIAAVRALARGERVYDPALVVDVARTGADAALTAREAMVLGQIADGGTIGEVAVRLSLSPGTVRNYVSAAIAKTRARNRCDAIRIARERGWL